MFGRLSFSAGRLIGGARRVGRPVVPSRNMGGGAKVTEETLHVPEGYDKLGKLVLVSAFFWIMYRAKENKGQLFGLYVVTSLSLSLLKLANAGFN